MHMIKAPVSRLLTTFVQRPSCFSYTSSWYLYTKHTEHDILKVDKNASFPEMRFLHLRYLSTKRTLYDILEVDKNASFPEIRSAYILKSKELHPDLNQNDPNNHEKFVLLMEAYNTLSKESSRREYDFSLAAYVHQKKMQQRRGSSHTSSSGLHRPGVGFHESESDERIFWDETIWHMRDKSKDQEFKSRPYYSVKGLKRQPNSYILFGILTWVVIGVFVHYFLISFSRDYSKSMMDKRDIEFHKLYKEKRDKALLHGNKLQREILMNRYKEEADEDS